MEHNDITIPNYLHLKTELKNIGSKNIELKRETDKFMIVVGDFKIPFSIIERTIFCLENQ